MISFHSKGEKTASLKSICIMDVFRITYSFFFFFFFNGIFRKLKNLIWLVNTWTSKFKIVMYLLLAKFPCGRLVSTICSGSFYVAFLQQKHIQGCLCCSSILFSFQSHFMWITQSSFRDSLLYFKKGMSLK